MMFLPAALLILLCVASAEDTKVAKRCYWCGPLAEQVHRSQRAPSCGSELEETACDPGYTHCAVVATSPPYVESRLCVKFYQDECYSLYCNTSKTWRMICPCKGDLCNGHNTERETKAFTALAKIVAKNKRSKRCLVGPKGFIPLTPGKKVENQNDTYTSETETIESSMFSDPTDEPVNTQTVMTDPLDAQTTGNDLDNNIEDTNQDGESEMQGDQPIENEIPTTEDTVDEHQMKEHSDTAENEDIQTDNEETNNEDFKTNSIEATAAMIEESKDNLQTITTPAQFVKIEETTEIPAATSMKPTTIEIELSVVHITNSNDNLPPPEALQQNVTPAKATVPTTSGTMEMTTTTQIETTTHSMKEVTKKIEKSPDTMTNNVEKSEDSGDKGKGGKNGEKQTLVDMWELVVLMNILIYITM